MPRRYTILRKESLGDHLGEASPGGPDSPGELLAYHGSERSWRGSTYLSLPAEDDPEESSADGAQHHQLRPAWRRSLSEPEDAPTGLGAVQRCGRQLICSTPFQILVALVIIGNAVVIGLETDNPDFGYWDLMEHVFLFIFMVELMLRLLFFTPTVFFHPKNQDLVWNVFDVSVVTLGALDFLFGLCIGETMAQDQGGFETVFQMVRLLRILRVFRIVRFVKQLYVLAYGFGLAAVAVFWVTVLMASGLYVCSVILVRTLGNMPLAVADREFFHERFGDIPGAMFTLFQLLLQPNLDEYHDSLMIRPWLAVFLILFVFFGSLGMIALLTGVLGEAMFEKNVARMEEVRFERERMCKDLVRDCGEIFDAIEVDDGGETRVEAVHAIRPKIAELFEEYSVPYIRYDLEAMISVMDCDGSGAINRNEFCRGILQMAQELRPMLVMQLHNEVIAFHKMQAAAQDNSLQRLHNKVGELTSSISAMQEFRGPAVGGADCAAGQSQSQAPPLPLPPVVGGSSKRAAGDGGDSSEAGGASLGRFAAEMHDAVRSLQGDLFALGARMEELLGDARTERTRSQLSELAEFRRNASCGSFAAGASAPLVLQSALGRCEAISAQTRGTVAELQGQTKELQRQVQTMYEAQQLRLALPAGGSVSDPPGES